MKIKKLYIFFGFTVFSSLFAKKLDSTKIFYHTLSEKELIFGKTVCAYVRSSYTGYICSDILSLLLKYYFTFDYRNIEQLGSIIGTKLNPIRIYSVKPDGKKIECIKKKNDAKYYLANYILKNANVKVGNNPIEIEPDEMFYLGNYKFVQNDKRKYEFYLTIPSGEKFFLKAKDIYGYIGPVFIGAIASDPKYIIVLSHQYTHSRDDFSMSIKSLKLKNILLKKIQGMEYRKRGEIQEIFHIREKFHSKEIISYLGYPIFGEHFALYVCQNGRIFTFNQNLETKELSQFCKNLACFHTSQENSNFYLVNKNILHRCLKEKKFFILNFYADNKVKKKELVWTKGKTSLFSKKVKLFNSYFEKKCKIISILAGDFFIYLDGEENKINLCLLTKEREVKLIEAKNVKYLDIGLHLLPSDYYKKERYLISKGSKLEQIVFKIY